MDHHRDDEQWQRIRAKVATWPPLTPAQRSQLAVLFSHADEPDDARAGADHV